MCSFHRSCGGGFMKINKNKLSEALEITGVTEDKTLGLDLFVCHSMI